MIAGDLSGVDADVPWAFNPAPLAIDWERRATPRDAPFLWDVENRLTFRNISRAGDPVVLHRPAVDVATIGRNSASWSGPDGWPEPLTAGGPLAIPPGGSVTLTWRTMTGVSTGADPRAAAARLRMTFVPPPGVGGGAGEDGDGWDGGPFRGTLHSDWSRWVVAPPPPRVD